MTTLPTGTVTFVFTDIEGSTTLLQQLGERTPTSSRTIGASCASRSGPTAAPRSTRRATLLLLVHARPRRRRRRGRAQRVHAAHAWPDASTVRVRMGLHTGEPTVGDEGYLGLDVVRAARICSAGHGGQILLSETTRALLGYDLPDGVGVFDLGEQN